MSREDQVYQRIGEFAVCFQGIENQLRDIGWFILDPKRSQWPPTNLRNLTNESLIEKVHGLYKQALPKCKLSHDHETEFSQSFASYVEKLHQLRRDRNRILHSAFIELKGGGETHGLVRSNPRIQVDDDTGETIFDQEMLNADSFSKEMQTMADVTIFLNQAHLQLINKL